MISKMIKRITGWFRKILINPHKVELSELEYRAAQFIRGLPKTAILFLIAYRIGLLNQTLVITFLSYGLIRYFSRGVHAKTSLGCFLVGVSVYFGITLLAPYISVPGIGVLCAFVLSFTLFALYAPSGTQKRPVGIMEYKRNKIISLGIILLFYAIGFCYKGTIQNILVLVSVFQAISVTPLIFKLTGQKGGVIYRPPDAKLQ